MRNDGMADATGHMDRPGSGSDSVKSSCGPRVFRSAFGAGMVLGRVAYWQTPIVPGSSFGLTAQAELPRSLALVSVVSLL